MIKNRQNSELRVFVPDFIKGLISQQSKKRRISESSFVQKILLEHIQEYADLTETEQKFVELSKLELEANLIKYIRSKSAERLTFLNNIKKQMRYFSNNSISNKKELINNIELSLKLAKLYEWEEEKQFLKEFLDKVKNNKLEYLKEKKQIEGVNDE